MANRQPKKLKIDVGPRQQKRRQDLANKLLSIFTAQNEVSDVQVPSLPIGEISAVHNNAPPPEAGSSSETVDLTLLDNSLPSNEIVDINLIDFSWSDFSQQFHLLASSVNDVVDEVYRQELLDYVEAESDDENTDDNTEFIGKFVEWHFQFRIKASHTTALLKILNQRPDLAFLPSDVRSLVKSMRKVVTIEMEPGRYHHFGLKHMIEYQLKRMSLHRIPAKVLVGTNCDGLPLARGSLSQFWVLACCLLNLSQKRRRVFAVGIYHGAHKPMSSNEFLRRFVEEAMELERNGVTINGRVIQIVFHVFVCDSPALAFILFITYPTGKCSCLKCVTEGETFKLNRCIKGRVTFPELDAQLRTDQSFREHQQPRHHKGRTILENLNIDMIRCFPSDSFHLLDLGMMRQLLHYWCVQCPTHGVKLSSEDIEKMESVFLSYKRKNVIPKEFARVPRTFEELARWKASELRQFRKYTGIVVLNGILPPVLYDHFLYFHTITRLMSDAERVKDPAIIAYCETLADQFLQEAISLYGQQIICNNFHKFKHFPKDCEHLGTPDEFSADEYENFLQLIKNMLAKSDKPLQQIVKRLNELMLNGLLFPEEDEDDAFITTAEEHCNGPMISDGRQFSKATFGHWQLTTKAPNNCVIMKDETIVVIKNFVRTNTELFMVGRSFDADDITDFFNVPFLQHLLEFTTLATSFLNCRYFQ